MSSMSKQKKTTIAVVAVAVVLVIAVLVCWAAFRPRALEGVKEITVNVTHSDETTNTFTYRTTDQYLGEVLRQEGLVDGEESEYGLYVTTVDGETVSDPYAWGIYLGGDWTEYGVDMQPLTDGDTYTFFVYNWQEMEW